MKISIISLLFLIFISFGIFVSAAPSTCTIEVTSPNGGEIWAGVQTITWTNNSNCSDEFSVYYNDGADTKIAGKVSGNSYSWNASTIVDGTNYRIRVKEANGGVDDFSDSFFTIKTPICGDGILESGEQCDSSELCCDQTTCEFRDSSFVCRASTGVCDLEETCSGSDVSCPSDSFVSLGTSCSDGFFCNGEENCDGNGNCAEDTNVDCSPSNILGISSCDNSPDENPFTFDFRSSFTSICDEETDSCSVGDNTINSECNMTCGAECLLGDSESCNTSENYLGTHNCTSSCSWSICSSEEYCGDESINGPEICDLNSQKCTDDEGYLGTQSCLETCDGWQTCLSEEFCGDGIQNGEEVCDDGTNNGASYGFCNSLCGGYVADSDKPETSIIAGEYAFGTWTAPGLEITLDCSDAESGCSETWYRINNGSWIKYGEDSFMSRLFSFFSVYKGFSLNGPGYYNVSYYSIDNEGNSGEIESVLVKMLIPAPFGDGGYFEFPENTENIESVSNLTVHSDWNITIQTGNGTSSIFLPAGTVISMANGENIDYSALGLNSSITSVSGLDSGMDLEGGLEFGIPSFGLSFSDAITLQIYVGEEWNNQTLNVRRSISGNSNWTAEGLSSATCLVREGICEFNTSRASYFITGSNRTTEVISSGERLGGAGGGQCVTSWSCTEWSDCNSGIQTRTCSYPENFCTPKAEKPVEIQVCTSPLVNSTENNNPQDNTTRQNVGITGAVIGALGSTGMKTAIGLIALVLAAWYFVARKKRMAMKQQAETKTSKKSKKRKRN